MVLVSNLIRTAECTEDVLTYDTKLQKIII